MIKSIPGSSYYVKRSEVSARQVRAALQTRDTAMKTAAVASKQFSEPKWDPELKHLLETAACRSYESTDEVMRAFQEHGNPKGSFITYNGNEQGFTLARISPDRSEYEIMEFRWFINDEVGAFEDEQGNVFKSFHQLKTYYHLDKSLTKYESSRCDEFVSRGFAIRVFESHGVNCQPFTLKLHEFTDIPPKSLELPEIPGTPQPPTRLKRKAPSTSSSDQI